MLAAGDRLRASSRRPGRHAADRRADRMRRGLPERPAAGARGRQSYVLPGSGVACSFFSAASKARNGPTRSPSWAGCPAWPRRPGPARTRPRGRRPCRLRHRPAVPRRRASRTTLIFRRPSRRGVPRIYGWTGLGWVPILRAMLLSPPGSPVSRSRRYVSAWLSSRETCIWDMPRRWPISAWVRFP